MLIQQFGFDSDRLRLEWISAGEGEKFQKTIIEFTNTIKELGPSPMARGDE
jgi:coenzyme F420-reducing hydrogenase delta subunit